MHQEPSGVWIMAYTTIDDPSAHFHTQLYVGNESTNAITNDANAGDFQPDFWFGADRTGQSWNSVYDSTRGATKQLNSNAANIEYTQAAGLTSFDSDGFTLGSHDNSNGNSENHVAWQWVANGGSRTTNAEDGNNPAGGYQANTTAGFSIVDYVGTGGAGTKTHGLGAVPEVVIYKNRDRSAQWMVYHEDIGATKFVELSTTAGESTDSAFDDTAPTSTVFSVGGSTNTCNADGENLIAYCFKAIQGYSKFGSYTGNGDADGTFVYTGFKPALLIQKRTDSTGNWILTDNKRSPDNESHETLYANITNAEEGMGKDLLSNGFKCRTDDANINADGGTYIYMAFAENPFVTSGGVPCTAR